MSENKIIENYGCYTFNKEVMKERIPEDTYNKFNEALENGESLTKEIADVIAKAMKEWAIEKGATHYTHWFSPLNGSTAGKHDSFLELANDTPILEFNGKLLRKGESDASSFPSGGIRATFEARGYTAWDSTSPAFIKDGSLYIPTLFCSYTGESLDNKTPLLKSCDVLSKSANRLLPLLGLKDIHKVTSYVGSEQEYFLIPVECYEKRMDLKFTGRTLFGANAPKGQELEDHYYGTLKDKVASFMKELDNELWKFGIPAKTKHNEAAPSQHEIACIYRSVNTTTDNNHLLMELMQDIAKKHGLRCLLHEKPFAGVNGSGKHNNWSIVTNTGINLFKYSSSNAGNINFLAMLACVVKGVDEYADLLRYTIATPSNDHRLGGNEAPPAVISIFLGEELDHVVDTVIEHQNVGEIKKDRFQTGVSVVPDFAKDNNDRNRTSPFAFTGNKFEFRGVGSSQSIALVNTVLNAILSIEMEKMADLIEQGNEPMEVIRTFLKEHRHIIFNGDGYSKEWEKLAKERGLPNIKNTVDAISALTKEKNAKMLTHLGIFTEVELASRTEIALESYCKINQVEALTAVKMIKNQVYPASLRYLGELTNTSIGLEGCGIDQDYLLEDIANLSNLIKQMKEKNTELEMLVAKVKATKQLIAKAKLIKDKVLKTMEELRVIVDKVESSVDIEYWPMPTYVDLLFSI